MNSAELEVQKAQLLAEKRTLNKLKQVYAKAAEDCEQKIAALSARTDLENIQSIVYQTQYQQALKDQLDSITTALKSDTFNTVSEYLTESYTNGYVGTMYELQNSGIPIIVPINQDQVLKAVEIDSQISTSLYEKLGENTTRLKKSIQGELSRGIANGSSYSEIAAKIAKGMNSPFKSALARTNTIARTEGHRVQSASKLDALEVASDAGADIVKQWDATLDSRTRPDHQQADGQIVELDEEFKVGGEHLKAPGIGGSAKQVINCRCCLLQRAKWALDEEELKILQERAEYYGLDKTKDFEDYKQKYNIATSEGTPASELEANTQLLKSVMSEAHYEEYMKLLSENPEQAITNLYANYGDKLSGLRQVSNGGCYRTASNVIEFDYVSGKYVADGQSVYSTLAHEYGHYFDAKVTYDGLTFNEVKTICNNTTTGTYCMKLNASSSDQFLSAVRQDRSFLSSILTAEVKSSLKSSDATASVQDAIDGLLGQRISWGHGDKYYNRRYNRLNSAGDTAGLKSAYLSLGLDTTNQSKVKAECRVYEAASEIWANVTSAITCGGKELEYVEQYLPNSYQALKDIIGKAT